MAPLAPAAHATPAQQILALQRMVGNQRVAAMLSPASEPRRSQPRSPAGERVIARDGLRSQPRSRAGERVIARDGPQLQTPWLLGGPRPQRPGLMTGQLQLDPELEAAFPREELLPERLLAHLGNVVLPPLAPTTAPLGGAPPRAPDPAPPDPADPPGFERPAEPASPGMLLGAVLAVPEVRRGLESVQQNVWGRLSSGERTAVLTTSITFGVAAVGGMLATPTGRQMLGQLSGVALPVPKVPWLSLEFSSRADVVGLGVHVDFGTLLPSSLGFGAAGPRDSAAPLYPDPSQDRR